ncbi:MAG: RDD family protein [Vicinamibacterales bacterium]
MRCPKCHYLSFEPEPRCRNCGNSLDIDEQVDLAISGTSEHPPLDLTLRPAPIATTGADVPLQRASLTPSGPFDSTPSAGMASSISAAAGPSVSATPPPTPRKKEPQRPVPAPTTELPLFMKGLPDSHDGGEHGDADAPLVKLPSEPRPPLAVRMKAPEAPPRRPPADSDRRAASIDRDLLDDLQRLEHYEKNQTAAAERKDSIAGEPEDAPVASARVAAAAIDAVLLAGMCAAILWITLRWCDLTPAQIRTLPLAPTLAFLLLTVVGYLMLFTAAGGQTIGKMLLHLRVVADEASAVTLGQAVGRACIAVPSVLALGAGFIPALVGEGRALHDRIAGTRVIRA